MNPRLADPSEAATPILPVEARTWARVRATLSPAARVYADAVGFAPKAGRHLVVPGRGGRPETVLFSHARADDPFSVGRLPPLLPAGIYRFGRGFADETLAALAFLLGAYRFTRYREAPDERPRLAAGGRIDRRHVERVAAAIWEGRNLVNTPANDLGCEALEAVARVIAARFSADVETIRDEALLAGFPLIETVGRAAAQAPRLVDLKWTGDPRGPRVTLVGKGVTFDTGGLDIKPAAGMLLMKKDMGGAATALALATMIMDARLPVRLRVLLPLVENAISGNAFRPGDIIRSRKGFTVEIGNTDAEGRLILADALAYADEEAPDLLLDFATLTGAARVALGPDLPPFYTADDAFAAELARHASAARDPLWRMPLWSPYDSMLDSRIADLGNVSAGAFAGSIIGALFLRRFVSRAKTWAHFDIFAWNPSTKPGRPEGGEIQAARALFDFFRARYPAPRERRGAR